MSQVFVDSSAWLAVADPSHRHHREASQLLLGLIRRQDMLVTSADVLAEARVRVLLKAGDESAARFHRMIERAQEQGLLEVVPVSAEISRKAWDIFERHHKRLTSLQHCTSSVIAGRLGVRDVFSFADDFSALGFRVWPQCLPGGSGDLQE
jgi:predicted nucleic acid-binding protein